MTEAQKQEILRLRDQGFTFTEIAEKQGLNRSTVKSFVGRYEKKFSIERKCLTCGGNIEQKPKTKTKKFCSDRCRNYYWHHYKGKRDCGYPHKLPPWLENAAADCAVQARIEVEASLTHSQFQREMDYGVAVCLWKEAHAQGIIDKADFLRIEKMYTARYRPMFHSAAAIENVVTKPKSPR